MLCISYIFIGLAAQVFLKSLAQPGTPASEDVCILREDNPACFVELGRTKDWRLITLNANSKLSTQVRCRTPAHAAALYIGSL